MSAGNNTFTLFTSRSIFASPGLLLCTSLTLPRRLAPFKSSTVELLRRLYPSRRLQGAGLRRHRRGGPVQPPGEEDSLPEPQPRQHAQLLQLQQQHRQPEQPAPARPRRGPRPHDRVHVSGLKSNVWSVNGDCKKKKKNCTSASDSLVFFFLILAQEPDAGAVRRKPTLRERATDRTWISAPFGALGPRGQVLPMTSLPAELTDSIYP